MSKYELTSILWDLAAQKKRVVQRSATVLLTLTLGKKLLVEGSLVKVFHQREEVRVWHAWFVETLCKDFYDAWVVTQVRVGHDSRAEHFSDLGSSLALKNEICGLSLGGPVEHSLTAQVLREAKISER